MFASARAQFNALPTGWLARLEQPDVEEVAQRGTGFGLREGDELLRRAVAVEVLGDPVAKGRIEDRVADLLAERLEGQATAVVDGCGEELLRPRRAGWQLPEMPPE